MPIRECKAERKKFKFRFKWLDTRVERVTIICNHNTDINKQHKQSAKLSSVYNYSSLDNTIFCEWCREVAHDSNLKKSKSWVEWKVHYLKCHLSHKQHKEALTALHYSKAKSRKKRGVFWTSSSQCQLLRRVKFWKLDRVQLKLSVLS